LTIKKITLILLLLISIAAQAQRDLPLDPNVKYEISDIEVTGTTTYNENTVIAYTGLRVGEKLYLPGEKISNVIKKLWGLELFSDINLYVTDLQDRKVTLQLDIKEVPELNEVKFRGIKEKKGSTFIKDNGLNKGTKVTENLITTTKNYIENTYKKKGYLNSKVFINTIAREDSTAKNKVDLIVNIDKGQRVKIKDIIFEGRDQLKEGKLTAAMKNTKKKKFWRFWKRSKYIQADYEDDKVSIVDKYKEKGYRDARIISDDLVKNNNETVSLNIKIEEGNKYIFGNIGFIGNTVYSDELLRRYVGIEKGDTYNGVLLQKRIADNSKPDADDITNLYQNNGYLFSTINPVEVNADGHVIDMEIRITEGKPVHFNKVTVVGNDKTNDHVVYREIRTRPGELYSKANVVRTVRELSQLGFFDAEQIVPNFNNPNPEEGTIDMEYSLVESGSSQIELQGGYGGGGFIGTLGLAFNNFAIKDLFKKEAYNPIPSGDGQKLALRLQASRFFQTYSFSFSEPWLGGKKPVQFSTSLSHTKQFLFDPNTRDADRNRRFNITGITFGIAKRLAVPDDYFTLSQAVSYQHYDLRNYNTGLFTFGDGFSNNFSYTIGLSRNNTFNDPIFPLGGSNFLITAKLSIPYSLFNKVDYRALRIERDENLAIQNDLSETLNNRTLASDRVSEIDQQRFKWLEFYKIKFKGDWYTNIIDKFVFKSSIELGYLGAYNQDRGVIPFERVFLGGNGLGIGSLDGRENVALRGYGDNRLSPQDGGALYNKYSLELRYPITLKQTAKIYALTFLEAGASYNEFKDYNPFDIKRSAGFGVRIFMPAFGLLGIDFGHGFDPLPGQVQKNGWETHFIIGQQF